MTSFSLIIPVLYDWQMATLICLKLEWVDTTEANILFALSERILPIKFKFTILFKALKRQVALILQSAISRFLNPVTTLAMLAAAGAKSALEHKVNCNNFFCSFRVSLRSTRKESFVSHLVSTI